ncbi:MAG: hypothetical protein ACYSR9_09675 [Planctomycetota bacterium]|jgi:opacity protein-like surface antigen
MKCLKLWLFLCAGFLLINSVVYGQDPLGEGDNEWQVSVSPYFWLPEIDGDSTVAGATASIDLSFSDIIDNFDVWGISTRVEAWKGDWGLIFDGMYVDLEGEFTLRSPPPQGDVDVEIASGTLDFAVAYKLIDMPVKEDTPLTMTFSPLGGVRYQYLEQEITLKFAGHPSGPSGTTLGGDEEWVEPFVGAAFKYDLSEKLAVVSRADFGGFGIGSASKLTWNFLASIDWRFKENMDLKVGYRVLDMDYSRHSGVDEFGWDGQIRGPIIALTIHY